MGEKVTQSWSTWRGAQGVEGGWTQGGGESTEREQREITERAQRTESAEGAE